MSSVTFHSPSGDAVLQGAERFHASALAIKIGCGVLDPCGWMGSEERARLLAAVDLPNDTNNITLLLAVQGWSRTKFKLPGGRSVDAQTVYWNTALRVGSRPVQLLVRIHAQCEIHAWVGGPNRAWLAEIVEEGLESGVMRQEMGWDGVVELLRARDDEPVVTSSSFCDMFPNPAVARLACDEDGEHQGWYALTDQERWRLAVDGLRADEAEHSLELKPENWASYYFGVGPEVSALNLECLLRVGAEHGAGA